MDSQTFHSYVEAGTGNEKNICQIYVLRNGNTVYDDCWHGCKTGDAFHIASVTKGITALLTGIAIDKGYLKSTNQKVLDFFPNYRVKRGERTIYDVELRHLLTMTAPYKYRSEPWTRVCTSPDWTTAALDLLGGRGGITGEFQYTTLGIQILAGVIENTAGRSCIDFANHELFDPLDIPQVVPHGASSKEDYFDYLMNKAPRKREWYSDPQGTAAAGWGLCLSAHDLAKIGQLVLDHGSHAGKQVISEAYLKETLTPRIHLREQFGSMEYGYLWYKPHADRQVFAAIGDGGNIIYVDKEKKISVGITGTFKARIFDRVEFIKEKLLPCLGRLD